MDQTRCQKCEESEERNVAPLVPINRSNEIGDGVHKLKQWVVSPEGNPEFATVLKVVRALGLRLHATTKHA
jgi:hypothetical protein